MVVKSLHKVMKAEDVTDIERKDALPQSFQNSEPDCSKEYEIILDSAAEGGRRSWIKALLSP